MPGQSRVCGVRRGSLGAAAHRPPNGLYLPEQRLLLRAFFRDLCIQLRSPSLKLADFLLKRFQTHRNFDAIAGLVIICNGTIYAVRHTMGDSGAGAVGPHLSGRLGFPQNPVVCYILTAWVSQNSGSKLPTLVHLS